VNWKWIGILTVAGALFTLVTVFGLVPEGAMQYVVSAIVSIGFAIILAKNTSGKFFRNGLMLGLVSGVAATLVQMLFFTTMLENNPKMSERFDQMPNNMNPVVAMAMFAPIGILFSALLMGLFTWVAGMLMGKASPRRAPTDRV
jgi:hypothetical protein